MEAVLTLEQKRSFPHPGMMLLFCIVLFAGLAPLLSPYTYDGIDLTLKNTPPSFAHWFGTDDLGRDLLVRCAFGTQVSLLIACAAVSVDLLIGVLYGGIAAYFHETVGRLMMRLADVFYSFPYLLMVIAVTVLVGTRFASLVLSLTLFGWITMARVAKGVMTTLMHEDYVLASKALGAGPFWIFRKHLLPNALGPIAATATLTIPQVIFAEAFLSFLGLGLQAPLASLGTMTSEGIAALRYYPWRLAFPALFITLTMLAFNVIGAAFHERLDPLERGR